MSQNYMLDKHTQRDELRQSRAAASVIEYQKSTPQNRQLVLLIALNKFIE